MPADEDRPFIVRPLDASCEPRAASRRVVSAEQRCELLGLRSAPNRAATRRRPALPIAAAAAGSAEQFGRSRWPAPRHRREAPASPSRMDHDLPRAAHVRRDDRQRGAPSPRRRRPRGLPTTTARRTSHWRRADASTSRRLPRKCTFAASPRSRTSARYRGSSSPSPTSSNVELGSFGDDGPQRRHQHGVALLTFEGADHRHDVVGRGERRSRSDRARCSCSNRATSAAFVTTCNLSPRYPTV